MRVNKPSKLKIRECIPIHHTHMGCTRGYIYSVLCWRSWDSVRVSLVYTTGKVLFNTNIDEEELYGCTRSWNRQSQKWADLHTLFDQYLLAIVRWVSSIYYRLHSVRLQHDGPNRYQWYWQESQNFNINQHIPYRSFLYFQGAPFSDADAVRHLIRRYDYGIDYKLHARLHLFVCSLNNYVHSHPAKLNFSFDINYLPSISYTSARRQKNTTTHVWEASSTRKAPRRVRQSSIWATQVKK